MGRLFGYVFRGLSDPRPDAGTDALLQLATEIRALGIPIVVTDAAGRVAALDNVPPGLAGDTAAVRRFVARLDVVNVPIVQPGVGTIHFGSVPIARRLSRLAALQGGVLLCLVALVVWAVRSRVAAARDRLWVAMAREAGPHGGRRPGAGRVGPGGIGEERRRCVERARGTGRGPGAGRWGGGERRGAGRRAGRRAGGAVPAVRAGRHHQAGRVGDGAGAGSAHRRAAARRPARLPRGGAWSHLRDGVSGDAGMTLALNDAQRAAVEHPGGPLLVLAGAGSGKTRVLTARIAHLTQARGVRADRIFAVTFTNKAAEEMRGRVATLLGAEPRGLWIGTFHSLSARLLRREAPLLGFGPNYSIYDSDDSEQLLGRLLEQRDLSAKTYPPRALHSLISGAKNRMT